MKITASGWRRQAAVVLGAATVTFAASTCFLYPRETEADDAETAAAVQRDIGVRTTKLGRMEATSRLVRDEQDQSAWYLEIKVRNPDQEQDAVANVEGSVSALDLAERMSRSMPTPRVVFRCREQIPVAAGDTAVRRCALPAEVAKRVAATLPSLRTNAKTGKTIQVAGRPERFLTALLDVSRRPKSQSPNRRG